MSSSATSGNPGFPSSEIEVFEQLICGFIGGIIRRASEIPEDKWNWSFSERTPTAREICEHSWIWLQCDRQCISVLDPKTQVAVLDPPQDRTQMLEWLESEKEAWRDLIRSLGPQSMDELRHTPDGQSRSIRGYLFHMAQHIVSKSGQMTMLHFDLGLDGGEPYDAPHPNRIFGFGSPAWPGPRQS
ncbi:MAG TPA: DinB family protein [Fimbriimonadaceae bacterium]|nr:DinB family protein [Fimbriimonadaceae bacterium]